MRRALSIAASLLLFAALPAAGQSPERQPARGYRFNEVLGARVSFQNGRATGYVVDVVINTDGRIESVLVRSKGELLTVPWTSVRFGMPEQKDRVMSTTPRSRLLAGSRLERVRDVESRPVVSTVTTTRSVTVGRPALLYESPALYRLDSLYDRGILMTTPSDRPSDLLKDRFEAHRAPPSRPWLRPVWSPPRPLNPSVR